jgi:hypothetical protein
LRQVDTASRGIRVISDGRITVDHPGIYSFTFSIQFSNTDSSIHDINVWLRKNNAGAPGMCLTATAALASSQAMAALLAT